MLQTRHLNFDKARLSDMSRRQPQKKIKGDYGIVHKS